MILPTVCLYTEFCIFQKPQLRVQWYAAGKSRTYDLALLDDEFAPVALLPGVEGYVKQGLECDDRYIYFFQTGTDANGIFVFD